MWAAGCSGAAEEGACGIDLNARVDALASAAGALETRATGLQADVDTACENILTGLGGTLPPAGSDPAAYTQAVCQDAADAIAAAIAGGLSVTVDVAPPICTIDANAQIACESSCYVDATCDPGTVETRCAPGELSVVCAGTCQANAYCESTATVAAMCNGSCDGFCTGTCDGSGIDGASCAGTCVGSCEGSCQITAAGGIDCGADARCRGGCEGTATLPECRTTLEPPACAADADCQAACEAQGSINATCTGADVVVVVTGSGDAAALQTVLEQNLPTLVEVGQGLDLLAADAVALGESAVAVEAEVRAKGAACVAVKLDEMLAAVQAAQAAAASLEVTVEVSVCVSGSTDGTPPSCGGA